MAKQEPPKSTGKLTRFPYRDLWEEFGEPWDQLYIDGLQRELIDRSFARARKVGATDLHLTKREVQKIIEPLMLATKLRGALVDKLYYLAGHYYSPRFHKLDGDTPAEVRKLLDRIARSAESLDKLMSEVTPAVWRYVGGARWTLGKARRGSPRLDWSVLQDQIIDLASSTDTVADEFPRFGRGTTEKVLLGRWLRHTAEAIEHTTGSPILTKTSDSAGKNFRFVGVEGAVFQDYCTRVDKGLAPKTLVAAVRAYQRHGIGGIPRSSRKASI